MSLASEEFLTALSELRNVILQRLLTTPLEVLQRKEFLADVETNTDKISVVIENMHSDLHDCAEEAEQQVHSINSTPFWFFVPFPSCCFCFFL